MTTLLTEREDWWTHWLGIRSLVISRRNRDAIEDRLTEARRARYERALRRLERLADLKEKEGKN